MESNEKLKKIKDSISENLWLNSWIKEPLIELIDKALDPTTTTVDCGFSTIQLNDIRNWANKRGFESIYQVCNHLLTNANEWPCKMWTWNISESTGGDEYVLGMFQGEYIIKDTNGRFISRKHARPIEQKPKELKDCKKDDLVYYTSPNNDNFTFGNQYLVNEVRENQFVVFSNKGLRHTFAMKSAMELFSPNFPTPAQIATAKAAAIEEVEKRFAEMEKGGSDEQ